MFKLWRTTAIILAVACFMAVDLPAQSPGSPKDNQSQAVSKEKVKPAGVPGIQARSNPALAAIQRESGMADASQASKQKVAARTVVKSEPNLSGTAGTASQFSPDDDSSIPGAKSKSGPSLLLSTDTPVTWSDAFGTPTGTDQGTGLEYVSGSLYYLELDGRIWKLNASTGAVLQTIAKPSWLGGNSFGLLYDGTNFWTSSSDADLIYKCDINFSLISSFASPGDYPGGIATDGSYLYITNCSTNKVFKVTTSGSKLAEWTVSKAWPRGLVYKDGYLYINCENNIDETGTIVKMSTTTGLETAYYVAGGDFNRDLTINGNDLWSIDANRDKIVKATGFFSGGGGGSVTELTMGTASSSSLSATNDSKMFKVYASGAGSLEVVLDGPSSADFDLYVRRDSEPTTTSYDARPYTSSSDETATLTVSSAGWYYIMVRSDDGSGSFSIVARLTTSGVTELALGTASSSSLAATGAYKMYKVYATGAGSLEVVLDGPAEADFDLYVKRDSEPTTTSYDARPYSSSSDETASLTVLSAGWYYIMILSDAGSGSFSIVANLDTGTDILLTLGTAYSSSLAATGTFEMFRVYATSTGTLEVVLDGPADADFDLYVKRGTEPTTTSYDARPYTGSSDETASLTVTSAGWYYIMILSDAGSGSFSIVARLTTSGVTELTLGTAYSSSLSATGDSRMFKVYATDAGSLEVVLNGPADADFDLYVKRDSEPTTSSYDARAYTGSSDETATLTVTSAGWYYIMIRSDGGSGSFFIVARLTIIDVTELTLGTASSSSLSATGTFKMFRVYATSTGSLEVVLDGPGNADFDLYVKRDTQPTTTSYDARPYTGSSDETATLPVSSAGWYYIMIRSATGSGSFTIVARLTPDTPGSLRLVAGSLNAAAGATIDLPLTLENSSAQVRGVQFVVSIDPASAASFLSVSTGSRCSGWTVSNNATTGGQTIVLYSGSGNSIATGTGEILKLSLRVASGLTSGSSFAVRLSAAQLSDNNNNPLTTTLVSGTVTIGGCTLPGDVTADGAVNIFDIIKLVDFVLGRQNPTSTQLDCGDLDDTGALNIFDIIALVDKVLGRTSLLAAAGALPQWTQLDQQLERLDLEPLQLERLRQDLRLIYESHSGQRLVLPQAFSLEQNQPNPFNPSTTISYQIPEGDSPLVSLMIYDLRGRLVRTLVEELRGPGSYNAFWDGTDHSGRQVPSGIYLYRLKAGNYSQARKMVLVK